MNIRFFGGLIAVALIVGGYVLYGRYGPGANLNTPGAAAIDAQLQSGDFKVYVAMKTFFPEAYGELVSEIAQLEADGAGVAAIAARSQTALANLRQASGANLLRANPDDVRAIVVLSRDLHRSVRDGGGRELCNTFAISGPPGLGNSVMTHLTALDEQVALLLTAMGKARSRPPYVALEPATPEDREIALDKMVSAGADPALKDVLKTLGQDGDICAGLIGFLDTILEMQNDRGERLRATYVRDLAVN